MRSRPARERGQIIFAAYLKSILTSVRRVLQADLEAACDFAQRRAGVRTETRKECLNDIAAPRPTDLVRVLPAQNLKGLTCSVLVLVVPRRQMRDPSWTGDCLQPHLLYSNLMRATDKCIVMTEPMLTMPLPEKGRLRREALELGVTPMEQTAPVRTEKVELGGAPKEETTAIAGNVLRRRLQWVRLCQEARPLWTDRLGVR